MSAKAKRSNKQNGASLHSSAAPEPVQVQSHPIEPTKPVERAVQPPQGKQVPVVQAPQTAQEQAKPQSRSVQPDPAINGDKKPSARAVELVWPWEGQNVLVAGSFNSWQGVPTESVGGVKKVILSLPPGKHEYKFIVDGEWKYDGTKPVTRDHRGNINNLIEA